LCHQAAKQAASKCKSTKQKARDSARSKENEVILTKLLAKALSGATSGDGARDEIPSLESLGAALGATSGALQTQTSPPAPSPSTTVQTPPVAKDADAGSGSRISLDAYDYDSITKPLFEEPVSVLTLPFKQPTTLGTAERSCDKIKYIPPIQDYYTLFSLRGVALMPSQHYAGVFSPHYM
jgi:hypothetical protein